MVAKLISYGRETAGEFAKISWLKLNTTFLTSAIVVFVAVAVGILFTGLDQLISMLLLIIFRANA